MASSVTKSTSSVLPNGTDALNSLIKDRSQFLDSLQLFPRIVNQIVYEYTCTNQEYLTLIALQTLNALWDPLHGVLRAMIRCEHSKDVAAGWSAPDLNKRLEALDAGQKAMKSYLDRRIPERISFMDEDQVDFLVSRMNQVLSEQTVYSSPMTMNSWLVHTENFGSKQLKKTTDETLRRLISSNNDSGQTIQLPMSEFFSLAETAYETSMEQFVDQAFTQVTEQLLPHLMDPTQLVEKINLLLTQYFLFGVQGPKAFTPEASADAELLTAMVTGINKELAPETTNFVPATYLLIPKTISADRPMNRALHDEVVRISPLAKMAFNASGYTEGHLDWFDRSGLREKCVIFKTPRGEERAILIPGIYCWNITPRLQTPKWFPVVQPVAKSIVSASMEDSYESAKAAIETGFVAWINFIKTEYPQYASEIISDRVRPLIGHIRLYREALLHTVLSGLKKERAGKLWTTHPSHFHDEFNSFLKDLFGMFVTITKEHGIKPLRTKKTVRLIELLTPMVATIQQTFQRMEQQFQPKTK